MCTVILEPSGKGDRVYIDKVQANIRRAVDGLIRGFSYFTSSNPSHAFTDQSYTDLLEKKGKLGITLFGERIRCIMKDSSKDFVERFVDSFIEKIVDFIHLITMPSHLEKVFSVSTFKFDRSEEEIFASVLCERLKWYLLSIVGRIGIFRKTRLLYCSDYDFTEEVPSHI